MTKIHIFHHVSKFVSIFFYDHVFGPSYRDTNVLMFHKYPITFDNDEINKIRLEGIFSLYELIFMKEPNKYVLKEADFNK